MTTLLQLVQQARGEMGLSVPTAVASSLDTDIIQTLALLNAVGYELQRQHNWQALDKEYRFTTVYYTYTGTSTSGNTSLTSMSSIVGLDSTFMISGTGINQDTYVSTASGSTVVMSQAASASGTGTSFTFGQTKYALPSDWDRQIDRTHYDKSRHWEMLGPESAQQWQWLKSAYISTGPRIRYRILGNYFQIWPLTSSNDYLGFEYISKNWVTASGTTTGPDKTSFTVDSDTCIYPDRLMVLGLKLKYFEVKGFDTTALFRDYTRELNLAKSNDQGSATLSFAPRVSSILIGYENIPDSGYGT